MAKIFAALPDLAPLLIGKLKELLVPTATAAWGERGEVRVIWFKLPPAASWLF